MWRRTNEKYEGEWRRDERNGFGTHIWHDGTKYTGEFRTNELEGAGVYMWPDGRVSVSSASSAWFRRRLGLGLGLGDHLAQVSPPGGFPSALNRGSPIDPSIETVFPSSHTRTVRGFQWASLKGLAHTFLCVGVDVG